MPVATEMDPAARFVRQRALGSGAFGKVFRAYDLELGIEVAIKRTARGENYDPAAREQLLQAARTELAATARLDHPGIARVFGLLGVEGGDTLLIEEFVEGPPLRQAMDSGLDRAHSLDASLAHRVRARRRARRGRDPPRPQARQRHPARRQRAGADRFRHRPAGGRARRGRARARPPTWRPSRRAAATWISAPTSMRSA